MKTTARDHRCACVGRRDLRAPCRMYLYAEEGEGARAWLRRRHVRQGEHHVASRLGLPESVHDVALTLAHLQYASVN